jgi:serine/threonine-protein kinase RsbW
MAVKERQLRIVGALANVSSACDFVVELAREAGLDERAIHHCYLAVDEACTNIIEHGYPQPCGDCVIDVICRRDERTLTIIVVDDSPEFDPLLHPDPDPAAPMSERVVGGWGIFFIKKLMDSVTYSHEGGRNRLIMVKNIVKAAPAPLSSHEMPAFRPIDIRPLNDKIWVVTPGGRLDQAQAAYLAAALNSQLEAGHRWLIVNMADVEFISSAGLKMLVSVWQRVRDQKGDLALAALNPRVHEVLEMIGLDLVFTLSDTPDQAGKLFALKVK